MSFQASVCWAILEIKPVSFHTDTERDDPRLEEVGVDRWMEEDFQQAALSVLCKSVSVILSYVRNVILKSNCSIFYDLKQNIKII